MDQLLRFIDTMSLDDALYWRVGVEGSGDLAASAEVAWRRKAQPQGWSVRFPGEDDWTAGDAEALVQRLKERGADLAAFERQLGVCVLTQAVFADMVLESARRMFGADVVTRSIADTKAFLGNVSETAERLSREPQARLRLVTE